jgi:hypothetical protein
MYNGSITANAVTPSVNMKSRIINGAMVIDQRNAGASLTPTNGQYTVDRWGAFQTTASKFSVQQNAGSVTPPAGFTNYVGCTSLSAFSVGSGDVFGLYQWIEGLNVSDLGWGTANAKTVTLSFWVRSSLTGTFGGCFANSAFNRTYPFSYTISAANTWEQKSVTVAGDTTGTWLTTNGQGIAVVFSLGTGTTLSGPANAWAATNYYSATGATSVVGTNGATFYLTGCQLEVGSTATSFDYRSIGTEDYLCKRYYQLQTVSTYGCIDGTSTVFNGTWIPKRATPTVAFTSNFTVAGSGASVDGYGAYGSGTANNRNIFTVVSSAEL